MKTVRFLFSSVCLLMIISSSACTPAIPRSFGPEYTSPLNNAQYVSTGATIILRYGPVIRAKVLDGVKVNVQGSLSGAHAGQTFLADDQKTIIFKPNLPFTPAETVKVDVSQVLINAQTTFKPISYSFTVAANQQPGSIAASAAPANGPPKSAFPNFLTLPQDIPHYSIPISSLPLDEGDIFVAPFYWTKSTLGSYLLILNNLGKIVYYQSVANDLSAFDFKVPPNGWLSYFDQKDSTFIVMDSHYQVVQTYQAGDGYMADLHDLQILPNGDALLMAYDDESVDMSKVVKGGKKNASVTALIIQELDPSKNVIFEWRSWDHFALSDSSADLTGQQIDLVHGNALALANDGNLLLSSRNLSEITKINLQTGEVIWRLGGKANMFKFTNGAPFAFQHDVRQLPNGDITIFDNQGTQQNPVPSRAIEYAVDEARKTVTEVWSFRHAPPVFGSYMGNTQRLADGNTFLSWGAAFNATGYAFVSITVVTPDGNTLFELSFDQPYVSYRAFIFPWHGYPDTPPDLAYKLNDNVLTLGYSWNGATEVASYRVYGGSSPQSLGLIEEQVKTDFETQSVLVNISKNECYFQVAALDKIGSEMARSKIISTDAGLCPPVP
jgi:hypothetical protein